MATPEIELSRYSKENMTLEIAAKDRTGTVLHLSGYTASFDNGVTFVAGAAVAGHTDWWQWLVAGPLAPDTSGGATVISGEQTDVIVRVADSPEIPAARLAVVKLV